MRRHSHKGDEFTAIRMSVQIGYRIAQAHPEIADDYRSRISQRAIAEKLQNNGFGHIDSLIVLEHSVRMSLIGNDDRRLGPVYEGAMGREEYDAIVKDNRKRAGEEASALCSKEGKGIYGLTDKQKVDSFAESARARGYIPWSKAERRTLRALARRDSFRQPNGFIYATEITRVLNNRYHNNRTESAVINRLRRERRDSDQVEKKKKRK